MESWISSLKSLFDLKSAIKLSIPGILGAAGLAFLLLPPKPVDLIPVVTDSVPAAKSVPNPPIGIGHYEGVVLTTKALPIPCVVLEYALNRKSEISLSFFPASKERAQLRQYVLEQQRNNLEGCLANEKRLQGKEATDNAALQRDLTVLEGALKKRGESVAEYEISDSPLATYARGLQSSTEKQVRDVRERISINDQRMRDRDWEIGELTRWKAVVTDRLSDPGRLRPQLGFDDYMSALSNHTLAFIFLAVVVGIITEALWTPALLDGLEATLYKS